MRLGALGAGPMRARLHGDGLRLQIGRFGVKLTSALETVARGVEQLYPDFVLLEPGAWVDFDVELAAPGVMRRWFRPQVNFRFDGREPFKPLPQSQAFAMFEWGLNWCISNNAHRFLVVHAAVVALDDRALILPGAPGSGKSTLCAALVANGWRLLSDEMALVALRDGLVSPVPRPISLKNASIDVVRKLAGDVVLGDVVPDTRKGTLSHMRPPRDSVERALVPARPVAIVFPKYRQGADTRLSPFARGEAAIELARNSFNYNALGRAGFEGLADLVEACRCYRFEYQNIDEALSVMREVITHAG